jgi:molybdate transport system ATP-binding protein
LISLKISKHLIGCDGPFELQLEFTVPRGELVVLSGASGSGKTTLLRTLAGLAHPEDGRIEVDKETWFDSRKRVCVPPQKRSVGFVFQNYALFPTMTVRRNLEFAAGRRKDPRVDSFLEIIELKELQHRYPEDLSGGQQQRVALARALIRRPKILLLDEPLSALDIGMREKLQHEILRLHHELGLTTILVSHDRSEIFRLADRVIAIRTGSVAFDGLPVHAFQPEGAERAGILRAEVVDIYRKNGSVAVVAAVTGDSVRVEVPLDHKHLRQLFHTGRLPSPVGRKTIP